MQSIGSTIEVALQFCSCPDAWNTVTAGQQTLPSGWSVPFFLQEAEVMAPLTWRADSQTGT